MRLSEFLGGIGRAVAYYPGLKKITMSTTATILLCQFFYWQDKTKDPDGWIYKTSDEIEEETGLTYYEQKTAKDLLIEKGLMDIERRRLDHNSRYRVNIEKVDSEWEKLGHKETDAEKILGEKVVARRNEILERAGETELPYKKGDAIDGIVDMLGSPAFEKEKVKEDIRVQLGKKFKINTDGRKWEEFIDFLYIRQTKYNEPVSVFIKWALENGFNAVFWTQEKMRTLYPQAFAQPETGKIREDFVKKLPDMPKEDESKYVPMPREIGRQKQT